MKPVTWLDDPAHFRPTRRSALTVGALGCFGLTLDGMLRTKAARASDRASLQSKEGKAKSVIHIFLPGGMAHQDTFDPKPTAPLEYRGEVGTIKTKLEGVFFGEHLKKTAEIADKITVIRSMTHGEAAHERGTHNMFTGYKPSPALVFPSFGAIVSHEFGVRNHLPPYVAIPNVPNEYANSGYLSSQYGPFSLGSDPANANFVVRDLNLPNGVDADRFNQRKSILEAVNDHFASVEKSDKIAAMDTFYQQAYSLISSAKAKEAFDINKEDAKLRDAYGRNPAGQRMLMARRLIEAGVRFVTLTYGGWDMHANIRDGLKNQVPNFDQAYAQLIMDLEQRGLLDSTFVMVSSEFGRTPKINNTAGRDHWPKVFSVALAGGGVKRGQIFGSSDPTAAEPDEDPVSVEDLATTMYHCLGIPSEKIIMAPGNRPIDIVNGGKVRKELLA